MDNQLGVNLDSYQTFGEGPGKATMGELAELQKALEVGQLRGGDPSAVSAGSLKVESLEKTLKYLTERITDFNFWEKIPKLPAFSTVEEYERVTGHGSEAGGFIGEGELPEGTDIEVERAVEFVKYIGTTRAVTHQAQLVTTNVGSLFQLQVKSGTLWVLRKVDRALSQADANIIPFEFNSFYTLHRSAFTTLDLWQDSDVVVDLRGGPLTEGVIESASEAIIENHGFANLLMGPPKVLSNFVKNFHSSKLILPNTEQIAAGVMGQRVKAFEAQFGRIELGYDKFLKNPNPRFTTDAATSAKAPPIPTAGTTPIDNNTTDAASRFVTADAGDYFYAVSAINRFGESALFQVGTTITIAAADTIDLNFNAGVGNYTETGYVVYRSEKDPAGAIGVTKMYPIFQVSVAEATAGYDDANASGGSLRLIRDKNRILANTDSAFLAQNDLEVWSFKQLAPLMKMDLALLSPADRFMVLLYGTPQLYAPGKMVRFLNVGKFV